MGIPIQCKKIDEGTVDALLTQHQQEDFGTLVTSSENKPWEIPIIQDVTKEDFNGILIIHKSDRIYILLKSISDKVSNHLKHIAAFKILNFTANRRCVFPHITFLVLSAVQIYR